MADLTPLDQADPGQPAVTAPTILNGARLNSSLDVLAGSRMCVSPCQCPQGHIRACTPNYDPDAVIDMAALEDTDSHTFNGIDWFAFDEGDIFECAEADSIETRLAEIVVDGAAFMLGRELDSAPLSGNPSLQTEAIHINQGGVPAHPRDGVSMLMQASALKGQYRSTFFAADHMLPALQPMLNLVNGQWRLLGRPIVFSPGISGDGPAGVAADPGTGYLYLAKGAADYNISVPSFTGATAERLNTQYGKTQVSGIIRFNPSCVHAIRICLKHESCCEVGDNPLAAPNVVDSVGASARTAARAEAQDALVSAGKLAVEQAAAAEAERANVLAAVAKAEVEAAEQAQAQAEAEAQAEVDRLEAEAAEQAQAEAAEQLLELHEADDLPEPDAIPDGPIPDVLAWVAGDRDRAIRAVAREGSEEGRNRSTLIGQLNEIIGA